MGFREAPSSADHVRGVGHFSSSPLLIASFGKHPVKFKVLSALTDCESCHVPVFPEEHSESHVRGCRMESPGSGEAGGRGALPQPWGGGAGQRAHVILPFCEVCQISQTLKEDLTEHVQRARFLSNPPRNP